jgi:hypothetical protein
VSRAKGWVLGNEGIQDRRCSRLKAILVNRMLFAMHLGWNGKFVEAIHR